MKAHSKPNWRLTPDENKAAEAEAPFSPLLRYGAIGALVVSLFSVTQAIASNMPDGYEVSVPVNFRPIDPQLWAATHAGSYQAALAIDPTIPDPNAANILAAESGAALTPLQIKEQAFVGPIAPRYVFRGATALDSSNALQCLTTAIYYEAASESDDGMRGVAQVVLNRVRHPSFPSSVCGVVYQGSERTTGCQFSFACDGAMARRPAAAPWIRARRIAAEALSGKVFPGVGLATHYHTQAIWPYWGKTLVMTNVIGAHIFHRWRGRWGELAAFRQPYSGRETITGPLRPISAQIAGKAGIAPSDGTVILDPAIAKAIEEAKASAAGSNSVATPNAAEPASVPDYTGTPRGNSVPGFTPSVAPISKAPQRDYVDPNLNKSGEVNDAFKESGTWIGK